MERIETVRETVELNPITVSEDGTNVLKQLIVEQADEIERDDIETVQTLVLDARPEGLSSHANILVTTDDAETTDTHE